MKKILFLLLCIFCSIGAMAQQKAITGVVFDGTGETVIGASVLEVGTTNGIITDLDGKFALTVTKGSKLKISFVGYESQTITVGDATEYKIILKEDSEMLDEVVVTGYGGSQKRAAVTTSISKLDDAALKNFAAANAGQALQGSVSGLRVTNVSGKPGEAPNIVLRGGATITNKNNEALVVIDGVVRSMNDINPADIESMQVLKDAASTAIYGARANGGVILITTKRGSEGKTSVSYKFKVGMNYARKGYEFVNAGDYLYYNRLGNKRINNDANVIRSLTQVNNTTGYGVNAGSHFDVQYLTDDNKGLLNQGWQQMTDPYDGTGQLIYKDHGGEMREAAFNDPAMTQDHYISISGGNDKSTFAATLGYYNEQGQVVGTEYERFTGTLNSSYKILPVLTVMGGVNFSYAKKPALWIGEADLFYRSMSMWPTWAAFDEEGNPNAGVSMRDGNPLYWKDKLDRSDNTRRTTMNIGFNLDIIPKKLILKENSSLYYLDNQKENFDKMYQMQNSSTPDKTRSAEATYEKQVQQQHSITLNYSDTFKGKHNIDAMVGGEYFDWQQFKLQAATRNSPLDEIPTMNVGSEKVKSYSYKQGYRILSGFARVNYNYEYKYLLSVVARYDGISKLSDNRWGFFPGISAGWNVTEEAFFKESKLADIITNLKPRVSYGVNGNVNGLGYYDVYGVYGTTTNYDGSAGFYNSTLVNNNLRWEQSKSFEVGLDIGFFNNRLSFILDYYHRDTDNLLTDLALPGYTGFSSMKTNLGSLRNSGFEMEVRANIINKGGFTWDVTANVSTVSNKILKLPNNGNANNRQGGLQVFDPSKGELVWVGGYQEGQSLGNMYGYRQVRILKDWDDVRQNAGKFRDDIAGLYGPELWEAMTPAERKGKKPIEPGDVLWDDLDKNNIIDSRDRVKVGNMFPNVTGGFSTTFSYKNLSLYGRFDYALGHTLYNDIAARNLGQYQGSFNLITEVHNMWSETNTNTDLPAFYYADQLAKKNITRSNNAGVAADNNSSRFYEKGDYLALRELTLSYSFPKTWIKSAFMSEASVFVTGQNLFYITGYTGTSPEASVNPDLVMGVDQGRYPMPRTVLFGLSVTF